MGGGDGMIQDPGIPNPDEVLATLWSFLRDRGEVHGADPT